MSLENLSDWWQMFFVAPLGFLLHRFVNHSNRITKLETTQRIYVAKMDEQCKSNRELRDEVKTMIGKLDGHLNNSKN